ncbi:MAG: hypothetical protein K9K62_04170 [Desulfobacteraceae bacterium]|nr:hypothetical protein [Desulfobacteraceae bacterium]
MAENNKNNQKANVIELSDIAVGTSVEDEAIIELTEEVVDEARNGISGATRDEREDSSELELDREMPSPDENPRQTEDAGRTEASGDPEAPEADLSSAVEDITRELDDYFPPDEAPAAGDTAHTDAPAGREPQTGQDPEASFTEAQLEAALERVIEKKYANIIERLINEAIEQRLLEDIEKIKELILNRNAGP